MAPRTLAPFCVIAALVTGLWGCASPTSTQVTPPSSASPAAANTQAIDAGQIYAPGPWTKIFAVRDASDKDAVIKAYERRTASQPDEANQWHITIERSPADQRNWTPERRLRLVRQADGSVAMLNFHDLTRKTSTRFEPALVLAPPLVQGSSTADAAATTYEDARSKPQSGEGQAQIEPLAPVDATPRVRTTLRLTQGNTRVIRTSELTLGDSGVTAERTERTVRWRGMRVDHADEVLTLVE